MSDSFCISPYHTPMSLITYDNEYKFSVCDYGVSRYREQSRAKLLHVGLPCLSRTRQSDALTSLSRPNVDQKLDNFLTKKHLLLPLLHHNPKFYYLIHSSRSHINPFISFFLLISLFPINCTSAFFLNSQHHFLFPCYHPENIFNRRRLTLSTQYILFVN